MKVKRRNLFIGIAVALAALVLFWYMKPRVTTVSETDKPESKSSIPALINTVRPSLRTFTLRTPWVGTVESQATVELTAQIAARVVGIEAQDEAHVDKGGQVMRLGGPQADALHEKLSAEVKSLKTQLDLATHSFERLEKSLKMQLATRDQVAAARDTQAQLDAQLGEARAKLNAFEKQVRISAPIDGTFTNRRVSVGQDVSAGQVVGEIINTGHLRIEASIFPPDGIELLGKEASIRLDENKTLTGSVKRVLPQASSTGAVMVWIEGPQIDEQLRPGQTVGGSLVVKVSPDAMAVPESAIVYDSKEHPYLLIKKDNSYEPRPVQLGLVLDGWAEVLSGLQQDESVVTQGAYELFNRQFKEHFKVED